MAVLFTWVGGKTAKGVAERVQKAREAGYVGHVTLFFSEDISASISAPELVTGRSIQHVVDVRSAGASLVCYHVSQTEVPVLIKPSDVAKLTRLTITSEFEGY